MYVRIKRLYITLIKQKTVKFRERNTNRVRREKSKYYNEHKVFCFKLCEHENNKKV